MSRITELEQKAQAFHQKLHQDTEKSLEEGMKPIFKDTKTILLKRLSIISESIEQGAESLKEQDSQATEEITTQILENKVYLKRQQSEATAEISEQIKTYKEQLLKEHTQALKEHTQVLKEFHTAHKKQVESLQANLRESTRLSEEIAKQSNLKTALISSNIVLISVALIAFISIILMTYAGTSKYSEIQAKEARLQQIERVTEEKILEYRKLLNDIYEIKSSKGKK